MLHLVLRLAQALAGRAVATVALADIAIAVAGGVAALTLVCVATAGLRTAAGRDIAHGHPAQLQAAGGGHAVQRNRGPAARIWAGRYRLGHFGRPAVADLELATGINPRRGADQDLAAGVVDQPCAATAHQRSATACIADGFEHAATFPADCYAAGLQALVLQLQGVLWLAHLGRAAGAVGKARGFTPLEQHHAAHVREGWQA